MQPNICNTVWREILEGINFGEFGILISIHQTNLYHYAHAQWRMATNLPN